MISVTILGAAGRMGQAVTRAIVADDRLRLCGALVRHGSDLVGKDAGSLVGLDGLGVQFSEDLAGALADADVAIDFTLPDATTFNVKGCEGHGCALVVGSTGHGAEALASLRSRDWQVPAVLAPNMSLGVAVLYRLADTVARVLPDFDAEIVETHHRNKKDAPSGTALRLAEVVAAARGTDLNSAGRLGRGPGDAPRTRGEIGISAVRAGEVVGEHVLMLAGAGERLELKHIAQDRSSFAAGALEAACWVTGQEPGLYDMGDVLGLRASAQ